MARQSLLWTALPNGYSDDGAALRVSLLLSPRLDAEADPETLVSFDDFRDWPATLAQATYVVSFGPPPPQPVVIAATDTTSASRVDDRLGRPDSSLWRALFPATTFVRGFAFKDRSSHQVLSYPAASIDGLVRTLYGRLAAAAQEQLPKASDILGDPSWAEVVNSVVRTDEAFMDSDRGLRDPRRQFDMFAKDGFKHLPAGPTRDLALFQLFHTPPSTPRIERYAVPPDDPRSRAAWRGYERATLPRPDDFHKQIDFHQIVAAMNQYPTLLRRLGLAVDLLIEKGAFSATPNAVLQVEVQLPPGTPAVTRTPDVAPRTRAMLDAKRFQALPRPAAGAGDYQVANGLLDLNPKLFGLIQSDVDGAGLKVMNFARTLGRMQRAPETQRDPTTKQEREVGAPALRNAGLMLVHQQRGSMLKASFARQQQFNQTAELIQNGAAVPAPELWAEDLVRGYRVDVWDGTTKRWRSLCQRQAMYDVNQGEVVLDVAEEEGTVRLAATQTADPASNPNLIWLHETLLSWTGGSLCAPAPGRTIHHLRDAGDPSNDHRDEVGDAEPEVPPGIRLRSTFRALKGSLPRLRYGRSYWMRARVVDLAGNSLAPTPKDLGAEQPAQSARPYLRYDPISAPAIALVVPPSGPVEAPAEGESMERIAIRTFNDTPAQNTVPSAQRARRFAVPPRTSHREAEQHGMIDRAGIVDPASFALLAAQDNSLAEEKILSGGPLATPVETRFAVLPDGQALPYLPDPLCGAVAARLFDHPDFAPTKLITIPFYPADRQWPDAVPFRIALYEGPGDAPRFAADEGTLYVPLPKAERAILRLSARPTREALQLLGVWNWLTAAQQAALQQGALNGQHWMLTPWREIELVHATQKPLRTPDVAKHDVDRGLGETCARPNFVVRCSIKSTDHLDLLAEWSEPREPLDQPLGENRARTDHAFAVRITEAARYAGVPEHTLEGPDLIRCGGFFHDRVVRKVHEFNDTRYRRIEYWFDATTRFREFMPASVLTEIVDGAPQPTDKNIKVTGAKVRTWIPSSAPPPAPEVLYVVPTFGWVRSDRAGTQASWRRGGGLRVYLNRPWNVSGYGEMLAVVLPSAAFSGDPMTQPAVQPLKNFVTQWGNDPIWQSPFVAGAAPKRGNFPLARTAADALGKWLPSFAPAAEADQPPGPFKVTGLQHPEMRGSDPSSRVEVAPHDVFYDDERRLWYCDIEVDWGRAYYPFIRLALARYQPVSVEGAHLSNIVLADFMSLAPDRWLNVTRGKQPRTRRVQVFGPTFSDSSSHQEAAQAPALIHHLADGSIVAAQAAQVARSSVVEVWLERFDPALGEDFGWQRAPGATVQRDVKPLKKASPPAGQLVRAKQLVRQRNLGALLSEGLLNLVFVTPTLWSGSVTLPEAAAGARYRLAIAEYEEYLVDDATPYNATPTKKDRRLVFIEHVELDQP